MDKEQVIYDVGMKHYLYHTVSFYYKNHLSTELMLVCFHDATDCVYNRFGVDTQMQLGHGVRESY